MILPSKKSILIFLLLHLSFFSDRMASAGVFDEDRDAQYAASLRLVGQDRIDKLRIASQLGHPKGQYELAQLYLAESPQNPNHLDEAIVLLMQSAEGGYWAAFSRLAELNAQGVGGLPGNPETAKRWYRDGITKAIVVPGDEIVKLYGMHMIAGYKPEIRMIGSRDEYGRYKLQSELAKYTELESQAAIRRFNEGMEAETKRAREIRQTKNLPPVSTDIQPLLLNAWRKHLNRGRDMWVTDVSCVKSGADPRGGGYKCAFIARDEVVSGIIGTQVKTTETNYTLHFAWTANGLQSSDMEKVVQEQGELARVRAQSVSIKARSQTKPYDASEETTKWIKEQEKIRCMGAPWSLDKAERFWGDLNCP